MRGYTGTMAATAALAAVITSHQALANGHAGARGAAALTAGVSAALPPKLSIVEDLQPVVHAMWQRSPTFRQQLGRLAANDLTVLIRVAPPGTLPRGITALTDIHRAGGRLTLASTKIGATAAYNRRLATEYIAHELEHVVEQLEGVDLEAAFRARLRGVRRNRHAFETDRAVRVGRRVRQEVLGERPVLAQPPD
jgi:hypothetical protein